MSAALEAVRAYLQAKVEYRTAYPGRDLQDDLDLLDTLQSMEDNGELSCTAEAAFDTFINNGKKVSFVGSDADDNFLQACFDQMHADAEDAAKDLGIYVDVDRYGAEEWL